MSDPEKLDSKAWAQARIDGRKAPCPQADRWAEEVIAEAKGEKPA